MRDYNEVTSTGQMESLLDHMKGFHDSMTREVYLLNNGFVESDGRMFMPTGFALRMVVQSQWEPHAIELIFLDVQTLDLKDPGEYWAATGKVYHDSKTGRQQVWVQFNKTLTIGAHRLFWRDRPDWTGQLPRLGREVPLPDVVPARIIQDEWRQCSACANAFECSNDTDYVRCPNCGRLTELEESG